MLEQLRADVCQANIELVKHGLVVLTWGNVSGLDRNSGLIVIKPSGVEYERMTPDDMVVVNLKGEVVEGKKRPSSDTPTHIELYKAFPRIGGLTHTHSTNATAFAQASKEIPCLGTTHADHFAGPVPVTRFLTESESEADYELNTGAVIVEKFREYDYETIPAVLVAGHGPFCWGKTPSDSVKNGVILERVAEMALKTLSLNPRVEDLPEHIMKKHYRRKHGKDAYYGQE
ncbi:MAG TPA: L-ribulose-5-phosphate 4-epimerase [Candidatus Kryptobacter bacterium]|nr:L-ribulose-5-phosphate 4-epimerase [Candidatus Kryptobacter bacterium]